MLINPLVLLDIFVYQAICFPIYGIEKANRSDFFVFDRAHLANLNVLQKLNCAYCSYTNGPINYTREIAARTEKYLCSIWHAKRVIATHQIYASFSDYGDGEAYRKSLQVPT